MKYKKKKQFSFGMEWFKTYIVEFIIKKWGIFFRKKLKV